MAVFLLVTWGISRIYIRGASFLSVPEEDTCQTCGGLPCVIDFYMKNDVFITFFRCACFDFNTRPCVPSFLALHCLNVRDANLGRGHILCEN